MADITRLLSEFESGDRQSAEKLLPLIYGELRKLAVARLGNERSAQTLQATALVHEAYNNHAHDGRTQRVARELAVAANFSSGRSVPPAS